MTSQQSITTHSSPDIDNFIVTVENDNDVIIIDTSLNRIGVNTFDPSYSIDVRSNEDVSGIINTNYLNTGNIISSLIPNKDVSYSLGSSNNSWDEVHAKYIEISGVTIKDANQFIIGEGSSGSGITFPTDMSVNGDMSCNNFVVDGITIQDANKFTIGQSTGGAGITFPLDINVNGNLTVTGTVFSTYLDNLESDNNADNNTRQVNYNNYRANNIDLSSIDIKSSIVLNNVEPKEDEILVYDGSKVVWKTQGENLVHYLTNNVDVSSTTLADNSVYYNTNDYILRYHNPPIRQPPSISLVGDASVTINLPDVYKELGAIAIDYRGIQITVDISGSVVSSADTYTIDYSARDREGRISNTITRTVIVN